MIEYIESKRAFLLSGRGYSYAMYVNRAGFLQQLYYGKSISSSDIEALISVHGKPAEPDPDDINYESFTDYMPSECGCFGKGDYRPSTVIIKRNDGAAMSRLKYHSHYVTAGALDLGDLPHTRKCDSTLTVILKDDLSETEIALNYSVSDDSPVMVRNLVVSNVGKESIDIKKAYSFCLDLPDSGRYSAMRLAGGWATERTPKVTPLTDGTLRIESAVGYSSHRMNPFLGILVDDCNEDSGECYGFNLLYSGSFALIADTAYQQRLRISGGINDTMFSWRLEPSDRLVTPQVAMCYSSGGLGEMSRGYHDFFRDCIINPKYAYEHHPIVINNWEGTYFDFDNDKLFAIIDAAKDTGIDTFVLDDGWFGARNDDKRGLGDWYVNETKLRGGLRPVIDRCKRNGLKFGLWFEPEMISEDSDLYRAHPDWAIKKDGVEPCRCRNQLILDFTRKEIVDYIFEVVSNILRKNDISYVKWDRNKEMTEFFSSSLPPDRQGEFVHRYTLGFYNLARRLQEAFPDVFFEGCAGGGGRFDGGALYYFPQIWTSDDTDGLERTKIQWGTSICYPVSSMSCHVAACPNHQTGRTTPFSTRGAIASLGATGYELDLTKLTEEEKCQVVEQVSAYKKIEQLVIKGDLYRISDPFNSNYFAELLVSKDKSRAYLVCERFRTTPCDHDRVMKLKGLDPDKTYVVLQTGVKAGGAALMNAGLLYPRLFDCESITLNIEEVTD